MPMFKKFKSFNSNQQAPTANQVKERYTQLELDIVYDKNILDFVSQNVRIVFNIFGGVPVIHQSIIPKNQMDIVFSFLSLSYAHIKQEELKDESVQVALYKYFCQLKQLIMDKHFGDQNFLRVHPQLNSFFMHPSFTNSQLAMKLFAKNIKDYEDQFSSLYVATMDRFSNEQLFSAVLQPNETMYSKAVFYAQFAKGVGEIQKNPKDLLNLFYQRMCVAKKPLIGIYKKSAFGELSNCYAYLNVALCSFHRVVDMFLRSSNSEQLKQLQQIQNQQDTGILKLLREHEYIVYAICELRAENKQKSLPVVLSQMERRINQLNNQDWLAETIRGLQRKIQENNQIENLNNFDDQIQMDHNKNNQDHNQLALNNKNKNQILFKNPTNLQIGNGQPLLGQKRSHQQSFKSEQRISQQLVPVEPQNNKRIRIDSQQQQLHYNIFDELDDAIDEVETKIWINQDFVEKCLTVAKCTSQKVFHFYGVKVSNTFLDAAPGDFICTQAVGWHFTNQDVDQKISLENKHKEIQTALFGQLQLLGHLVYTDMEEGEAKIKFGGQFREQFHASRLNQSFFCLRTTEKDRDITKKFQLNEYLRPVNIQGNVAWNQFEEAANIMFDKDLPFYYLHQEYSKGDCSKTWFSACLGKEDAFKPVKLHNFWQSLLSNQNALDTLLSSKYFDIFSSAPKLSNLSRTMKTYFQSDYQVEVAGTLASYKFEQSNGVDEDFIHNDEEEEYQLVDDPQLIQPDNNQQNLNLGSSLINMDGEDDEEGQINSHSRNPVRNQQDQLPQFNADDQSSQPFQFDPHETFTEEDIQAFFAQLRSHPKYQKQEENQNPDHPVNPDNIIDLGNAQPVIQNDQPQGKTPTPTKAYSDPDPVKNAFLNKFALSLEKGRLICNICFDPYDFDSRDPWLACVQTKCSSIFCSTCLFSSYTSYKERYERTKLFEHRIFTCPLCQLPLPYHGLEMRKCFANLKLLFDEQLRKDQLEKLEEIQRASEQRSQQSQQAISFGAQQQPAHQEPNQVQQPHQLPNVIVDISRENVSIQINKSSLNENSERLNEQSNQSSRRSNIQIRNSNQSQPNSGTNNSAPVKRKGN